MKIDYLLSTQLGIFVMVYGPSGSGKTKCWGHLPPEEGLAILSEANGVRTIKRMFPDKYQKFEVEFPQCVDDFQKIVAKLIKSPPKWAVFDTVTSYYKMIWDEFLEEKNLKPSEISFNNYRHCMHYFMNFMLRLVDLANQGTNVFMTCHSKWMQEGDDSNKIQWTAPDLPGQLPELVSQRLDVLCFSQRTKAGMETRYRLKIPHGRCAGKDILGVFDGKTSLPNDFSSFLPTVKGGGSASQGPTSSTVTPPRDAGPPPSLPTPSNRHVPAAHKKLLRSQAEAAGQTEEMLNEHCKVQFGKENIDRLTRRQFDSLQEFVGTLAEAKEVL